MKTEQIIFSLGNLSVNHTHNDLVVQNYNVSFEDSSIPNSLFKLIHIAYILLLECTLPTKLYSLT